MIFEIILSKNETLTSFAKRIPNAEKMMIDYSRDKLTVFFDGIHEVNYSIDKILKDFKTKLEQKTGAIVTYKR